jgi:hypothetical protein
MTLAKQSTKIALAIVMTFVGSQVVAQPANSTEAEIAALKKQLLLMEKTLDRLQKQKGVKPFRILGQATTSIHSQPRG